MVVGDDEPRVSFCPGDHATVRDLPSMPDLNDTTVKIVGFVQVSGRWHVQDKMGNNFLFTPENLVAIDEVGVAGPDLLDEPIDGTGTSGSVSADPASCLPTEVGHDQSCPAVTDDAFQQWCDRTFTSGTIPSDELTILLLGQTGSGKSSFLNLLCNYPSVLRHGSEGVAEHVRDFRDLTHENSVSDNLTSKTDAASTYNLSMGPLRLRIVDTPGFGDTRGPDVDKQHAKRIVDCIRELGTVHAITMVLCGRDSRMTAQLKYALSEVCAILPKTARQNIAVVFTNTASPLYLTFNVDAVSQLVEHTVAPERQIFIENPYVLWERSMQNQGKVDDSDMCDALAKEFTSAGQNLGKFFNEVIRMRRLNTEEFNELYKLRQAIEMTTVDCLRELDHAQQQQKQLSKQMEVIRQARNEEDMHKEYARKFSGKRWVFKDSEHHGTFCGAKDCHSNCHAPCIMEKTMENEKFKKCSAFRYVSTKATLACPGDRDELLEHFEEKRCPFLTDQDGGEGTDYFTILKAPQAFHFMGRGFLKGADVIVPGSGTDSGLAAREHVMALIFPVTIKIRDESEQDICKVCGHNRSLHYHDEKIWEEEHYEEEIVDQNVKDKYDRATNFRAKQEELVKGIEAQITKCRKKQAELGETLVLSIRQFEEKGLGRNYAMLLQNQRDLLQQHIDTTLQGDEGGDVTALKQAARELDRQLNLVLKNQQMLKNSDKLVWAQMMLGVSKVATLPEVERAFQEQSQRVQHSGNEDSRERLQELKEARKYVRQHLTPGYSRALQGAWQVGTSLFRG